MKLFLFFTLVIGAPALIHFKYRSFWPASFLSAFVCGLVLTALIFMTGPQKTSWYAFLFGTSIAFLAPAFLIGLLFVSWRKEIALPEIQVKDPSSKRQALILGLGAIAIGLAIAVVSIASPFDSASKDEISVKALLGAIAFLGLGLRQLIRFYWH